MAVIHVFTRPVPLVLALTLCTGIPVVLAAVRVVQIPLGALTEDDLRLAAVPVAFFLHALAGLLFGVLVPLCAGASFIRETPLHTETVAAVARRFAADMLVSAPVHLRSLTLLSPGELPPLGRVFSSGAALPGETARLLGTRLGLWVTEIYGASETGGIAWRRCRQSRVRLR